MPNQLKLTYGNVQYFGVKTIFTPAASFHPPLLCPALTNRISGNPKLDMAHNGCISWLNCNIQLYHNNVYIVQDSTYVLAWSGTAKLCSLCTDSAQV